MLDLIKRIGRPIIFDGAMGTMIQSMGLKADDVSRGDAIAKIHRAYVEAGADVVTTNTFGTSSIMLSERGLADKADEINRAMTRIACGVGAKWVAGELGPTSKLPTLGHISFFDLERSYIEQATALIEEGVDLIIISTSQDPLQMKAAASAARQAMRSVGRDLPLIVSVTVEKNGAMLVGARLSAALASIEPFEPAAFGINCALGPDMMEEYLAELSDTSPFLIICRPNAGMPESRDGKPVYPLGAKEFAKTMSNYVEKFGIEIVGGCCGTTSDHIRALADAVKDHKIMRERSEYVPHCASLFNATSLDQEPKPLIVAEQTNANGSRKFRELVSAKDWDGCVTHARKAGEGSHVLDVCTALTGSDEVAAIHELIPKLVSSVDRPIMIDSTKPDAIEAALSHIGGRAIINSINLEDGGEKAKKVIALARRFGAALVCLTIDEKGMATTATRKVEIAKELVGLAVREGMRSKDLLIDPLVFTLASGDQSSANAGVETLNAIDMIKKELPEVHLSLGVSNVSFGLLPRGRRVLTSYFLLRAIEAGADAAIVNVRNIVPLDRIDNELLTWIERLVDNDTKSGDPLTKVLGILTAAKGEAAVAVIDEKLSPEDKLKKKVIEGDRSDLKELIEQVLEHMEAKEIVNGILMRAMKVVGERFGGGTMPLPFVLQSAETMRASIEMLSEHLKSDEAHQRGTIVLATVRGDVHDIGKNLVDAILSNNGFRVINLGIRQTASSVMDAVQEHSADAIGLSGLLVSSTEIMREDLEVFRHNDISVPVLCGGAALTEKFTQEVLGPAYESDVYYCADAFGGLKAMEEIAKK
jgi:5-methyltetrahydrofolate--homocysteine methyltransferase